MGASRRSAGEPLSMRSTLASVLVAKNWKMDSMQRALMSLQSRKPSAYAIGSLPAAASPVSRCVCNGICLLTVVVHSACPGYPGFPVRGCHFLLPVPNPSPGYQCAARHARRMFYWHERYVSQKSAHQDFYNNTFGSPGTAAWRCSHSLAHTLTNNASTLA